MLKRIALLLLLTSAFAQPAPKPVRNNKQPTTVKIGTLTYAGGGVNQFGDQSIFNVNLTTAGVTLPITFADITVFAITCPTPTGQCLAASQDLQGQGPTTTPTEWSYYGGSGGGFSFPLPNCNDYGCVCIEAQLLSATGKPFPVTLVTGQTITVPAVITVALEPLPGQLFVQVGQSVDIVLQVPAPQ